jgi:hypothetical protein
MEHPRSPLSLPFAQVYGVPNKLSLSRPEVVLPDRALCLPTCSHFLIMNKTVSLSLFLSFSLARAVALSRSHARGLSEDPFSLILSVATSSLLLLRVRVKSSPNF